VHGSPPTVFPVAPRTLLGASPLLATPQEDRHAIRAGQDPELWREVRELSSVPLAARHRDRFVVAPLDILPVEHAGRREFQLIELNGTGIGGLTNMPEPCVAAVLAGLSELAAAVLRLGHAAPLVLIGISDRQWHSSPRHNPLAHEKVLYADALARGFERCGTTPTVCTLDAAIAAADAGTWPPEGPTVVLGYSREFLPHLRADAGRLALLGAPVGGVVNDRLFHNITRKLGAVDPAQVVVANACHHAGSDKGAATIVANALLARRGPQFPSLRRSYAFAWAADRGELIAAVLRWLRERRSGVVIKPCGTGGGDGVEFFLDPDEPDAAITERVHTSVTRTERAYGTSVFPYTLCEYLDTATWPAHGHHFHGHKYELRVVVHREGAQLRAFPSIVKFSCERYDPAEIRRPMLLNNITAGSAHTGTPGRRHMLPLCNRETLAALAMTPAQLGELCRFGAVYVHAVLDHLDAPHAP